MRLYSPEWVRIFNEAVAGLEPEEGLSFTMRQVVEGDEDGTLEVTLAVGIEGAGSEGAGIEGARSEGARSEGARITLHVGRPGDPSEGPEQPRSPATERLPDVTVRLAHADAVALARGERDPASLLRSGRVKVRGNLSALVAGQAILTEAAARLASLSEGTTF